MDEILNNITKSFTDIVESDFVQIAIRPPGDIV